MHATPPRPLTQRAQDRPTTHGALSGMRICLWTLLFIPVMSAAEPAAAMNSAKVDLSFSVVVPPVFRVLHATPTSSGVEYRVWTNMKSVSIDGREFRFGRAGESTLTVPHAALQPVIVQGL